MIGVRKASPLAPRQARLSRHLPAGLIGREWLVNLSRPRPLLVRVVMPLVLGVPLVTGHAPSFWAGMLLTVMTAMVGAVGSGVALARARSSGLLTRLAVTPRPAARLLLAWVIGGTSVDVAQLLPLVIAVLLLAGAEPVAALALGASVVSTLLVANVLGTCLSRLAGGPGEVLLDVAVVLSPLLFLAGLFTGVPETGWRHWAALGDPFTYLHSAWVAVLGGEPRVSTAAVLGAAALWGALAVGGLAATARGTLGRV